MIAFSSTTALMCFILVALTRPISGKDSPEPDQESDFDQSVYKEFLAAIHYNERDREAEAKHIQENALKAKYGENRMSAAERVQMADDISHEMVEVAMKQRARLEHTG
ncbi:unnamed protein product [Cylicocyclus nassatus]|uniref:Uncharacterized protein n=1 Tax=Cylicocyclus nassatus TaxID=53992 RepID=A0AA36DMC9_CYLNA|nr:unnamed protein product [Cylicocyclus nassatus]